MYIKSNESIIERLQSGKEVLCVDCGKAYYHTPSADKTISREFRCGKCGSVVRVTPNIVVK